MRPNPKRLLQELERIVHSYAPADGARKTELLRALARRRLPDADSVLRLHEALCFLRAYPDGPELLARVESLLDRFRNRGDLRAHREELADSGLAGTPIHYAFYWRMARWLADRWPDRLTIDWQEFEEVERLESILDLLVTPSEVPALDESDLGARDWLDRFKSARETDGAFLVRRFEELPLDFEWSERLFETIDTPFRLDPGPDTPSRTLAHHPTGRVHFQTQPLDRSRPELAEAIRRRPRRVRSVAPGEARKLIELAREAMVTRSRDLDVFANADPRDARLIDFGDGLEFACIGVRPERRLLLESVYGFLTLKNGVPIGYVLASGLFESSEVAYNVFESYRSAEAAQTYGRVLAMVRWLFGSDSFAVDPYQLGHGNPEGLASGAWWFYYKLGFRPRDAEVRRLLRRELRRMRADPGHRSSEATLDRLSAAYMYWQEGQPRETVMGRFSPGRVGEKISAYMAERFGAERRRGSRVCAEEAAELLGLRRASRLSTGERIAWSRWSPLVLVLPGIRRWSAADRRALIGVIRAKGGRRESDFVRRFDAHRRLRKALLRLQRGA